ncbi:MAG: hypothetical protein ACTHMO_06460 [Rhodanobacteraceae bacterium]
MPNPKLHRLSWYVVAFALVFAAALLAWEVTHGGVPSHHFLDRADMPTVSNWWMLIVLPVLGWLASRSVLRRAPTDPRALPKACAAIIGALLVGVALSVAFVTTHGKGDASSYVFFAAIASGLVFPIYRAEYVFGFVLGMAFTFGAVLPTLFALIAACISAIFHLLIWPAFAWAFRRARA